MGERSHAPGRGIIKFNNGLIGGHLWVSENLIVAIDSSAPNSMRGEDFFPIRYASPDHVTRDEAVDCLAPVKLIVLRPFIELWIVERPSECSAVRQ